METQRLIDRWCAKLFEHGLETYDGNLPETERSGNVGGAKLFWYQNWKDDTKSKILFNKEAPHQIAFGKVLRELSASLYSVNRVEMKNGQPVTLRPPQTGFLRTNSGLMLYMQFDEDPQVAIDARERIIEAVRAAKGPDLTAYIEVASRINCDQIKVVETKVHRDFSGADVPMKLSACIIMALPSGSVGSTQFWSFRAAPKTRADMANSTTAPSSETEDIPF